MGRVRVTMRFEWPEFRKVCGFTCIHVYRSLSPELLAIDCFDSSSECKEYDSVRIDEGAKCFALFQVSAASLISGYDMITRTLFEAKWTEFEVTSGIMVLNKFEELTPYHYSVHTLEVTYEHFTSSHSIPSTVLALQATSCVCHACAIHSIGFTAIPMRVHLWVLMNAFSRK